MKAASAIQLMIVLVGCMLFAMNMGSSGFMEKILCGAGLYLALQGIALFICTELKT